MNTAELAREQLRQLYDSVKDALQDPMDFYPVDITSILQQNGWTIHEVDGLGTFEDGQSPIGKCDFQSKEVTIDLNLFEPRKRYTLAHELGHIVLHGRSCNTHYRRSKLPPMTDFSARTTTPRVRREEREADQFAESVLMPSKAVRAHFFTLFNRNFIRLISTPDGDTTQHLRTICNDEGNANKSLCNFFGVSLQTMSIRLKKLRLVG